MKKNETKVGVDEVSEAMSEAKVPTNEEMSVLINAFADKAKAYCKADPSERGVVLCFINEDKTRILSCGSGLMRSMCLWRLITDDDLQMAYFVARMVVEAK